MTANIDISDYPFPTVIHPPQKHTHTLIFLHGRGNNASHFSTMFIWAKTSTNHSLQQIFPGLKLVFPTAPLRHSVLHHRARLYQWFDIFNPANPSNRQESQIPELRTSITYTQNILKEEIRNIGAENVLLGGLSQGCATALLSMLLLKRKDWPACFIGMSGYMPFSAEAEAVLQSIVPGGDGEVEGVLPKRQVELRRVLSNILNLEADNSDLPITSAYQPIPVLLGHGTADTTVPISVGEAMLRVLRDICDVTWKTYEGFGHWWKEPDEIDDLVGFMRETLGMQAEDVSAQPESGTPFRSAG